MRRFLLSSSPRPPSRRVHQNLFSPCFYLYLNSHQLWRPHCRLAAFGFSPNLLEPHLLLFLYRSQPAARPERLFRFPCCARSRCVCPSIPLGFPELWEILSCPCPRARPTALPRRADSRFSHGRHAIGRCLRFQLVLSREQGQLRLLFRCPSRIAIWPCCECPESLKRRTIRGVPPAQSSRSCSSSRTQPWMQENRRGGT